MVFARRDPLTRAAESAPRLLYWAPLLVLLAPCRPAHYGPGLIRYWVCRLVKMPLFAA